MLWRPGAARRGERSTDRLPPGQRVVKGWPVLHEGRVPAFDPATWRLRVWGAVERPIELSWDDVQALPRVEATRDWHCVTTRSRYDVHWSGHSVDALLDLAGPAADATHAMVHAFDEVGYTTNLALADLAGHDNLLATHHDGAELTPEHGGPIRLVVHHLYAWKSCKWLGGIEVLRANQRGYWEQRGYHDHGDPWLEQRYSYQE